MQSLGDAGTLVLTAIPAGLQGSTGTMKSNEILQWPAANDFMTYVSDRPRKWFESGSAYINCARRSTPLPETSPLTC